MHGIECTFGVARLTLSKWIKKANELPPLSSTLDASQDAEVLGLDRTLLSNTLNCLILYW